MIVVSNTSPLMNLAVVGRLDVLQKLYGRILVPHSVRDEIVVKGKDKPGSTEVATSEWLRHGTLMIELASTCQDWNLT